MISLYILFLIFVAGEKVFAQSDIYFIENKGQWEENVLFRADLPGGKLFVEKNRLTYLFYRNKDVYTQQHQHIFDSLDCHSVRISFLDCNPEVVVAPTEMLPYYHNYYIGNDKSKWKTGVCLFSSVKIKNLYDGIDLVLFARGTSIKYNFILSSDADPLLIKMLYEGHDKMWLDDNKLKVVTSVNVFTEMLPEVYFLEGNFKKPLNCFFNLKKNILSFTFPDGIDHELPLIIDPVVVFSSYSGSVADNFGYTATYDDSGYAYSGGTVFSLGFPVTTGAYQLVFKGGHKSTVWGSGDERDIGILKYKPDGTSLIYATYLGGSGNDDPHSMVVDANFNLIVFGNTSSPNFPVGQKFYDSTYNGNFDIYLAKLSIDGKILLASTYLGGSDEDGLNGFYNIPLNAPNQCQLGFNYGDSYRGEVNVDNQNRIIVSTTTKSSDFPVINGAIQSVFGGGNQDAVAFRFSNDLDTLQASTFIGGNQDDAGYGVAVNSSNEIYICGGTQSSNLKTISGKYQPNYIGGIADGFLYYISEDFKTLKAATFIGTDKYDQVYFVQTDLKDMVYITGQTKSDNYPVKNVKYYIPKGKMFISKFNPGLDSMIFSGVFGVGGTNPELSPSAFLVDICERIYFSGWGGNLNDDYSNNKGSFTTGLPVTADAFRKTTDGSDFYLAVFSRDMQSLLYATFYGGIQTSDHVDGGTSRFDKKGVVYQSVCASCGPSTNDFPTYPSNVHSHSDKSNNCNNALFKIDLNIPDLKADFSIDTIFCLADSTSIMNISIGGAKYYWDFGILNRNDDTSSAFQPRFHYPDTGTYKVTLIVSNINTCDQSDTISKYVKVYNQAEADFKYQKLVCENEIEFEALSKYGTSFKWDFGDTNSKANYSNQKKVTHIFSDSGNYKITLIVDSGSVCEFKVIKSIRIEDLPYANISISIDSCNGNVTFYNYSKNSSTFYWDYGDQTYSVTDLQKHNHKYSKADTFHIVMIAMPNTVCADSVDIGFRIKIPPANILISLDTCLLTASFINISPYSTGKGIWNFGDGKDSFNIDTVKNYKYALPGTYIITLLANFGTLCIDTVKTVLNIPELPIADFSDSVIMCNKDVWFFNHSLNCYSYYWDFGNGQIGTQTDSFVINYTQKGKYAVKLIAKSLYSCSDTITDTVQILHLANADFEVKWDSCTNRIKITNNSTKNVSYYWNFGNSQSDTISKSSFIYQLDTIGIYKDTLRVYTIKLMIADSICRDSTIKNVTIYSSPKPDFLVTYDSCMPVALFRGNSHGAINVFWELGDNTTSNKTSFAHKYAEKGNYKVKFYINRDTFCSDSASKTIYVGEYEPDLIEIPNIFTPGTDGINDIYTIKNMNFKCDKYEFYIYNRWGQEVYRAINQPVLWDGKVNGIFVSGSTYYYVFKSNTINRAGTITLIR